MFFAVLIISSILVFGYSPYVINFVEHGHPFYPLFGEGAVDIMKANSPRSFEGMGQLEKLFLGFFSETANIVAATDADPTPKIPLTVHPGELEALSVCDIRIGGFGVLYSAILIVQTPIIIVTLVSAKRKHRFLFQAALSYLIPACILMLCLGESWWARYSAYFYFTSPLALILLFADGLHDAAGWQKYAKMAIEGILAILLAINMAFFFRYGSLETYRNTKTLKEQLDAIAEEAEEGRQLQIGYDTIGGRMYSLTDRGIPFEFIGTIHEDEEFEGRLISGEAYRFSS